MKTLLGTSAFLVLLAGACSSSGGGDGDEGEGEGEGFVKEPVEEDQTESTDNNTGDPGTEGEAEAEAEAESEGEPGFGGMCDTECAPCGECVNPLFAPGSDCADETDACAMNAGCMGLLCCFFGCPMGCPADACADPECTGPVSACDETCGNLFCGIGECTNTNCGYPFCMDQCAPAGSACEDCVTCFGIGC